MFLLISEVRVGYAAILHNGVIVPGVFTEEQYNSPLCNLAWGWFYGVIVV
jgi:hypothetical protein